MENQKSLNDEQRALVSSAIKFTEATVKNICRGRFSYIFDDILQDAYLMVCKAVLMFDPSLGMKLETYLYPFIQFSVRESVQRFGHTISYPHRHKIEETFISLLMQYDEDGNCIADDLLSDRSEEYAQERELQREQDKMVESLLKRLTTQERKIICLYFGFDTCPKKLGEIARKLKLSQPHLMQIFNEALMKMEEG